MYMKTWQEEAKEYLKLAKNPLADQRNLAVMRKRFEYINIEGLSQEDKDLLNEIFN